MYKIIPVDPFNLILFGGTGDLARREILPGLYRRFHVGQIPGSSKIICVARKSYGKKEFSDFVHKAITENLDQNLIDHDTLTQFLNLVTYISLDANNNENWESLKQSLDLSLITAFYLSVGPSLFSKIINNLDKFDFIRPNSRIVVEKPFGHDFDSSRELNKILSRVFSENQVYRIDHYLGKETVQNLMALRFGNVLFEPLWNSQYIDHIQITVAEKGGIGGRGEYYDNSGAMRDMVQNHLMQLLCLVAMEPPSIFSPDAVRDEKLKVIRSLEPLHHTDIVLGQYGSIGSEPSYKEDAGNPRSTTESYIALKCKISNWRWANTAFYLRTGKRLRKRVSEIAVVFKDLPHSIFQDHPQINGNVLAIRLQPNEGINMTVTIKEPGPGGMRLIEVPLDMSFAKSLNQEVGNLTKAYERLVMDVIRGNQTLFMRGDEVEAAWQWTDKVISCWQNHRKTPQIYDPYTSGPEDAFMLTNRNQRRWREIEI